MYIQVGDLLVGPGTKASDSCNIFLDQRGLIGSTLISLKGTVPDQIFVVKHIEELSSLSESLVHSGKGYLPVDQSQVVSVCITAAVRICASKCAGKAVEHIVGTKAVSCAKPCCHGNFIGLAVSV